MKIREGFVSNSSSTSFVVRWNDGLLGEAWKALKLHDPRAPSPFPTVRDVALAFAEAMGEELVERVRRMDPSGRNIHISDSGEGSDAWAVLDEAIMVQVNQNYYGAWDAAIQKLQSWGVEVEREPNVPDYYYDER